VKRTIFGEEHDLFRREVRRFVEAEVKPNQERGAEAGIVDREAWRKAGAAGLLCPWMPEEYGGAGGDFLLSVVVMEELAQVLARAHGLLEARRAQGQKQRSGPVVRSDPRRLHRRPARPRSRG
jgi:alkylation response protein AidB-like acyl-CoA dehydrogenase